MIAFLQSIFTTGHVRCGPPCDSLEGPITQDALQVLREREKEMRLKFPGRPPSFVDDMALWAAISFYRACQAFVYRDLNPENVDALLNKPAPANDSADAHYSVDIAFRFLPELLRHATSASPDDCLVTKLRTWANQWPLSSVGCQGVTPISIHTLVAHPGLLQYYVDRVLELDDVSRASEPDVARAIRRTVSLYPDKFQSFSFLWSENETIQQRRST